LDFNQLYFDHQISLMRASATQSIPLRALHRSDACKIARHIEGLHRAVGAGAAVNWEARCVERSQ
jgi:hypothetical protein